MTCMCFFNCDCMEVQSLVCDVCVCILKPILFSIECGPLKMLRQQILHGSILILALVEYPWILFE